MAHADLSERAASAPADPAPHHHGEAAAEAATSPDQHDGDDATACTMLVTCGAPAAVKSVVALKAVQAIGHPVTAFVVAQHPNPTLLGLTPPPRA